MNKGIGVLLIAGAFLAVALLAACDAASSAPARALAGAESVNDAEPYVIEVTGTGQASAAPDLVVLIVGVSAEAPTVQEANSQVREAMSRLLDSLKQNGVEEKDIQTQEFRVYPVREERGDEWIVIGYGVTHMLRVRVRDMDKVGEVIDEAVEAGGDLSQVQGVSFVIDDSTALKNEARAKAMADAYAKAEQMAALAGVSVGQPIYITDVTATPSNSWDLRSLSLTSSADGVAYTDISPGELDVTVNVHVKYAIG